MVGRIMSRPEARKTPGKKMMTTTYKKGGSAKKKSKFPDHSGDGKITKKDILMAKGVIPKKASGGSMKKQGYNARKDEQLGMTRGKQAGKKMSMKGRRDVAKATRKPKGSYGFKK